MKQLDRIKDAFISGSAACATSGVMLSICSRLEEGSWVGALNGPSQWVWGEEGGYERGATLQHTGVGVAIHHATSVFWALFYEERFGRNRRDLTKVSSLRIVAEAASMTGLAYVVDYHFTPKRFRPGFKKHLGPVSIFASYAAFAAGLALTSLVRRRSLTTDRAAAQLER